MPDKDFFAFADYPLVAAVSGSSPEFAYHPIVDRSTWSFLVTHKIYHGLLEEHLGMIGELSSERFELLLDLLHQVPQRLHASVPGNHFCFLGPSGGQAVADSVDTFAGDIDALKASLVELTGIDASGL